MKQIDLGGLATMNTALVSDLAKRLLKLEEEDKGKK